MDKQDIKELMQQFDNSSLTKFKLENKDYKLYFSKKSKFDISQTDSAGLTQITSQAAKAIQDVEQVDQSNMFEVRSPMVGTFYASAEAGGKPYVQAGDQIKAGQIICIIDVMKTMNEIPSPVAGKVVSIHAEDGELMEFDSLLFVVDTENVS
ncbi:MAG TPA: acetyl-CoA carboxylase biotin carboxyl carrier protein [Clostridiaceae bacterium]|nr:acetyl-CoA carboxylase biotin carboxyl carrier protein [Clostridiaceae bacterium]